jgi:hypothetical protein
LHTSISAKLIQYTKADLRSGMSIGYLLINIDVVGNTLLNKRRCLVIEGRLRIMWRLLYKHTSKTP